ncbi:hypothetical protein K466DRAFT_527270 [Polyporus arcularius HHB13444]|uniref:BTB domain-containing protein n=1 Tax=Polyporus arcularius HHB13444 TaxID=1314778 RepID=A0A5C3PF17_9APHY|nr:hypothetical protein K466DRAFT_527270 [Polyporus arcularius HHB13444]
MATCVPRKSARLEAQDEDGELEGTGGKAERDRTFWFQDGTIVVLAGNIEFKVYAGPLIEHSPVFQDMFSLPQAGADVSTADRVRPTVHLSDSPCDLRYLFELMMPSKTLRPFGSPVVNHDKLAAWIRMGHKYQIDVLVQEPLDRLRAHFPNNFDTYVASLKRQYKQKYSIGVVNLARLTDARDLLPVALMSCCQIQSGLTQGFQRIDGTWEQLSPGDLELCFNAKERLIQTRVQFANRLLGSGAAPECHSKEVCTRFMQAYLQRLTSGVIPGLRTPTPLSPWGSNINAIWRLCETCRKALTDDSNNYQREIFARLPTIMGVDVEGWGEA